ncbi:MAG: TolC family protein, partial [Cyclobacteriaceae bacterium]
MMSRIIYRCISVVFMAWVFSACTTPVLVEKTADKTVPESFATSKDTTNSASINWTNYFADPNLSALIETALQNNQELNITLQEIQIANNEVRARKGEY